MIIKPSTGPRRRRIHYPGRCRPLKRPDWQADDADHAFYHHLYLRDNPAGLHRELWFLNMATIMAYSYTRYGRTHYEGLARDVALSPKTKVSRISTAEKVSKSRGG